MAITNDWMCISLHLSVPATFHVSVDLVTNTSTKTVYTVDNVLAETAATDMLTIFEVKVDATESIYSQLVIYVSEGTVIRNVDIQKQQCNSSSELHNVPIYCIGLCSLFSTRTDRRCLHQHHHHHHHHLFHEMAATVTINIQSDIAEVHES